MGRLDKILVVDLEATCWEKDPPEGQKKEIIEIGMCDLDIKNKKIENKQSIIVKPMFSTISEYCTKLTTITQEQVDAGIQFKDACDIVYKRRSESGVRVWSSYGDYDRIQFEGECDLKGVKYPLTSKHINVKTLFALAYNIPKEVGLAGALNILKMPLDGTHHRGDDDAWNIAKILLHIINRLRTNDNSDRFLEDRKKDCGYIKGGYIPPDPPLNPVPPHLRDQE